MFGLLQPCTLCVRRGSGIKEKIMMEKVNKNSRDSLIEEDTATDTAQGLQYEDIVEKKGWRNLIVWKYCDYLKSDKMQSRSSCKTCRKHVPCYLIYHPKQSLQQKRFDLYLNIYINIDWCEKNIEIRFCPYRPALLFKGLKRKKFYV